MSTPPPVSSSEPAGPVSHGPPPPDALARAGAIAVALGRLAVGVGALGFTRPALDALGFEDPAPQTLVLARMAGVRDLALGIHALAVRDDAARLREASLIGIAVDAGDAFAFGTALARREGMDAASLRSLPLAGAAVVTGALVAARLGRSGR